MPVQGALGMPGAARRVEQHGRVHAGGVDRVELGREVLGFGQGALTFGGISEYHHGLQSRKVVPDRPDAVGVVLCHDDGAGRRVRQDVAVGVGAVEAGHRQHGGADRVDTQVESRHLGALRHDHGHPVAPSHAQRHQEVGVPFGEADQFPVGPDVAAPVGTLHVQGDPAPVPAPAVEDLRGDVHALGDIPLEAFDQRLVAAEPEQVRVEQSHQRRMLPSSVPRSPFPVCRVPSVR